MPIWRVCLEFASEFVCSSQRFQSYGTAMALQLKPRHRFASCLLVHGSLCLDDPQRTISRQCESRRERLLRVHDIALPSLRGPSADEIGILKRGVRSHLHREASRAGRRHSALHEPNAKRRRGMLFSLGTADA